MACQNPRRTHREWAKGRNKMNRFPHEDYERLLFFVGAGMSAESGVPTYRGVGGIWEEYRFEDYACQRAFERNPDQVLDFHEMRRAAVQRCMPHPGHACLAELQRQRPGVQVVTQNIDGLLQRAGIEVNAELHGSLWRLRCPIHGIFEDATDGPYTHRRCAHCQSILRPDITWFEDAVNEGMFQRTATLIRETDLFVAVGTSGVVWPAAGFTRLAKQSGAYLIEINPEDTEATAQFDLVIRAPASVALPRLFSP